MIDFPSAPTTDQIYNSGTGPIYVWDGVAWSLVTQATRTAQQNNLIVNPCVQISIENGTTAGTTAGYYVADQWLSQFNVASAAMSFKIDGTLAAPSGSGYRIQFKTTTAKASMATGEYVAIATKMEAVKVYGLGWHTPTPKQAILRFVFNGAAGTYSVSIRNDDRTLCYVVGFTISAGQANTDVLQVFIIPPPATGNFRPLGTAMMFDIWITLASGTQYVAPAAGWNSGNMLAAPGQTNMLAVVNNQALVCDIGLYPDPDRTGIPPTFVQSDYASDVIEAHRYFRRLNYIVGRFSSATVASFTGSFYPMMRANPTASLKQTTGIITDAAAGANRDGSISSAFPSAGGGINVNFTTSGATVGGFCYVLDDILFHNARM